MELRGRAHRLLLMAVLAAGGLLALPAGAWATGVAPAPAYNMTTGITSLVAGTSMITGSNCDDCVVTTALPFDFTYMGQTYSAGTALRVGSNGTFSFDTAFTNVDFSSTCSLPEAGHGAALFPLWEDLDASKDPTEGIFTAVSGSAPSRVLTIEWRTQLHTGGSANDVHFEVQLLEGYGEVKYVYQTVNGGGGAAAVAIQQASLAGAATNVLECKTGGIKNNEGVYFNPSHPTVKGVPEQGQTLQATPNGFTGSPAPIITYQWQRCDSQGTASTCVDIPNGTGDQFPLTHADVHHTLRVRTTATNASGSASTFSGASEVITPEPPPSPLYSVTTGTGATYVAGTLNTGNSADDGQSAISFPFPVTAFGRSFSSGYVGSNGSLGLGNDAVVSDNSSGCLPQAGLAGNVIAAYQMDQRTDQPGAGVFSRVIGTAPHRTFVLDWRTAYYSDTTMKARYEILLRENSPAISVVFGPTADSGDDAVSGIQHDPLGPVAQFSCNSNTDTAGTIVTYTPSQPVISAAPKQGTPVTFKTAHFSGNPTLKTQWERCNSGGLACALIAGATGAGYVPAVQDIGRTLRVRQTATNQFGSGVIVSNPSGVVAANTAPKLTSLKLTPGSFRAAPSGGSIASPTGATGTTVSFALSFPGSVRFTVARVKKGKRTVVKGSFRFPGKAGANSLHFTGRLAGHPLTHGQYILFAQPSASGHRGAKASAALKILP